MYLYQENYLIIYNSKSGKYLMYLESGEQLNELCYSQKVEYYLVIKNCILKVFYNIKICLYYNVNFKT